VTEVNSCPPRSIAPALYPNQLLLWLAFSCACAGRTSRSAPDGSNGDALAAGASAAASSAPSTNPRVNDVLPLAVITLLAGVLPAQVSDKQSSTSGTG